MKLINDTKKDWEWWQKDEAGYKAEQDRRDAEFEKQFKQHMGSKFAVKYKLFPKELEDAIKNQAKRLARLQELKAPAEIVQNEQHLLEKYMTALQKEQYLLSDKDKEYRRAYIEQESRFRFNFKVNVPDFLNYKEE
jgi:hypothetical protein